MASFQCLIAELERLDAAATRGTWEHRLSERSNRAAYIYSNSPGRTRAIQVGYAYADKSQMFVGEPEANGALFAFIGTHRGAILAHLKRLAELEGQRSHAGSKETE